MDGKFRLEGPYLVSTFDRRIDFILLASGWMRHLSLKAANLNLNRANPLLNRN